MFLWHAVALLTGNLKWDLSGDLGALLPWHVSADSVDNVPDGGDAVSLGDGPALGGLDHALLFDWNLLAHALNLALASGSNGNSVMSADSGIWTEAVDGLGVGLGFSLSLTLVQGDGGGGNGWSTSGGKQTSGDWAGSSDGTDGSWGNGSWDSSSSSWDDSWLSNNSSSWLSNVMLYLDLTLDSNQLSFLADLVFNVLALFNVSEISDGVGFVDAFLLVPGGALFVWNLTGDWTALLISHSGACGIEFGPELSLADGGAGLLVGGGALGRVGGVVNSLANWVGLMLVAVRLGVVTIASVMPLVTAMISVASSVTAVVTAVVTSGLSVSLCLWFTHHQSGCQDAQKDQILVHFFFLPEL